MIPTLPHSSFFFPLLLPFLLHRYLVLFDQEQTVVNPKFMQQDLFGACLLGAAEDPKGEYLLKK
jgi:hypothetical protein